MRPTLAVFGLTALVLASAAQAAPVETRPTEATGQSPAFPGQTRAAGVHSKTAYRTQVLASGLDHPWALAFLPDGKILISQRAGGLRTIDAKGVVSDPLKGTPAIIGERLAPPIVGPPFDV